MKKIKNPEYTKWTRELCKYSMSKLKEGKNA